MDKDTASKYLNLVKKAEDFQKVDGWYDNTKKIICYMQGDWGTKMYTTKYVVNTIYNLINLIIPSLYFQNPYIRVKPQKKYFIKGEFKIDGNKRAMLIENVLNSEIKMMKYKNEMRKIIQDTLIGGIGIMKFGKSGSSLHEDDYSYLDDGDIFAQRISPFDYFFDPMSTAPQNARFEIYRYIESLESVKKNKMLKGTGDLEGTSISDGPKKDKKDKSKEVKEWIELYEFHDHEKDKVLILTRDNGSRKRILYNEDKKYEFKGSDFSVLKFTGDNDTFRGISPMMMVEDESLAINEVITLTINHLQKFAGVVLYEEGALDDDDLTRFEYGIQGDMLQTQNGALREGRVKREAPMSMGGDYYNNFNLLTNSIDRTLAIPDFQRSAVSGKRKTAYEVNVSASDAASRRSYYTSFIKDFVIESMSKITSLMQQFYDQKRWIDINGEYVEWIEWTKEDIQGEYTFDFDIEDIKAYSASKAQALIQAIQIMGQQQIFAPVWQKVDPMKLANKIFTNMDLNLDSVMKQEQIAHYEHDPYQENEIIKSGKRVIDPFPGEPHEQHIDIHTQGMLDADEKTKMEGERHIQMHQYWQTISGMIPGKPMPQQVNVPSSPEVEGGFTYNKELKEQI